MNNRPEFKVTRQGFGIGVLFWLLYSLLFGVILTFADKLPFVMACFTSLTSYLPLALLSIWIYYFCRIFTHDDRSRILFFVGHLFMAVFVSALWVCLDYGIHYLIWGESIFIYKPIVEVGLYSFIMGVILYGVMAGVFYVMFYQQRIKEKEVKTARLESETRQAELKALKSQVNPHFLFNTLNTIYALMDSDVNKAKKTVTELSDLLRYSMASFYKERVPLQDEIEMVKQYLDIEKARFAERLAVQYNIQKDIMDHNVPPMILQPLVENAIKHGIAPLKEGGMISLSMQSQNERLQIIIEDTGKGAAKNGSTVEKNGIGLKNLKKRLEFVYGDDFILNAEPKEKSGFVVRLEIPKL